MEIVNKKVESLIPYVNNARTHSDEQVKQIAASIKEFGFTNPILLDGENGIIAGHGRVKAAELLNLSEVPCIELKHLTEAQKKAYIIADNKLALNAGWDEELLKVELDELKDFDFDVDLLGFEDDELSSLCETIENNVNNNLVEKYGIPPFSIFDTRQGYWQDRKRQWLDFGFHSAKGRSEELTYKTTGFLKDRIEESGGTTSIFDPVLCEIIYKWFNVIDGEVLDPFAGGVVRGFVASKLNYKYTGIDISEIQINENNKQITDILSDNLPKYILGDSTEIDKHITDKKDLLFSCPPYADLEKYSDNPKDISNMSYPEFLNSYRDIIKKSVALLKDDRFACFVVGEVRDKKGIYYNFVSDTIKAFIDAGMIYYNEIILINMVGTVQIRCAKPFNSSRKIGKCHQNILIFYKGDIKNISKNFNEITFDDELFDI